VVAVSLPWDQHQHRDREDECREQVRVGHG